MSDIDKRKAVRSNTRALVTWLKNQVRGSAPTRSRKLFASKQLTFWTGFAALECTESKPVRQGMPTTTRT